jgi:hypothetical protein
VLTDLGSGGHETALLTMPDDFSEFRADAEALGGKIA